MKCSICGGDFGGCRLQLKDVLMFPLLCRPVRCIGCGTRCYRPFWVRPVWKPVRNSTRSILVAKPYRTLLEEEVANSAIPHPADDTARTDERSGPSQRRSE